MHRTVPCASVRGTDYSVSASLLLFLLGLPQVAGRSQSSSWTQVIPLKSERWRWWHELRAGKPDEVPRRPLVGTRIVLAAPGLGTRAYAALIVVRRRTRLTTRISGRAWASVMRKAVGAADISQITDAIAKFSPCFVGLPSAIFLLSIHLLHDRILSIIGSYPVPDIRLLHPKKRI